MRVCAGDVVGAGRAVAALAYEESPDIGLESAGSRADAVHTHVVSLLHALVDGMPLEEARFFFNEIAEACARCDAGVVRHQLGANVAFDVAFASLARRMPGLMYDEFAEWLTFVSEGMEVVRDAARGDLGVAYVPYVACRARACSPNVELVWRSATDFELVALRNHVYGEAFTLRTRDLPDAIGCSALVRGSCACVTCERVRGDREHRPWVRAVACSMAGAKAHDCRAALLACIAVVNGDEAPDTAIRLADVEPTGILAAALVFAATDVGLRTLARAYFTHARGRRDLEELFAAQGLTVTERRVATARLLRTFGARAAKA